MAKLIPFDGGELLPIDGGFLIPKESISHGVAYYLTGAEIGLREGLIGLALTPSSVVLCDTEGPVWSLTLSDIEDMRTTKLDGYTISMQTDSGSVQMIPPKQIALEIVYAAAYTSRSRMLIGMLTPMAANRWLNDINAARWSYIQRLDDMGHQRDTDR